MNTVAAAPERTVTGVLVTTSGDVATLRTMHGETFTLPASEWTPRRRWARGDRVTAAVVPLGSAVIASVTTPQLPVLLATALVPELRDGRVRVMGVARAAGQRTKLAVAATVDGVDAVAACVGRGACRVRALVAQLDGERLDIVEWNPDQLTFLHNALAPARPERIEIADDGVAEVYAPRHQMAAAVGEGGLNSALAGELAGISVTVIPS